MYRSLSASPVSALTRFPTVIDVISDGPVASNSISERGDVGAALGCVVPDAVLVPDAWGAALAGAAMVTAVPPMAAKPSVTAMALVAVSRLRVVMVVISVVFRSFAGTFRLALNV
jgi:hypothetical protein